MTDKRLTIAEAIKAQRNIYLSLKEKEEMMGEISVRTRSIATDKDSGITLKFYSDHNRVEICIGSACMNADDCAIEDNRKTFRALRDLLNQVDLDDV